MTNLINDVGATICNKKLLRTVRRVAAFIAFVVITGACTHGAVVAYHEVHHTPALTIIGVLMGFGLAVMVATGIAPHQSS